MRNIKGPQKEGFYTFSVDVSGGRHDSFDRTVNPRRLVPRIEVTPIEFAHDLHLHRISTAKTAPNKGLKLGPQGLDCVSGQML
jgi:hypothetical protein